MNFHGEPIKPSVSDIIGEILMIVLWICGVAFCTQASIVTFIGWTKYTGDETSWTLLFFGAMAIGAPAGTIFCLVKTYRTFVNFLVAIRAYFVEYTIWEIHKRQKKL